VDNHDATFVGDWGFSTARTLYYGDNYRYAWGCGDHCAVATSTATFTTNQKADISGEYMVYIRYTTAPNREETAEYKVYSVLNGTETYKGSCLIDQRKNGGEWRYCKTVFLPFTAYGRIKIGNENTSQDEVVVADGVRFVRTGVDGTDIMDGTITDADIASNSITSSHIANDSITSADIQASTILGDDVAHGTLYHDNLGDEAGVEYTGGDQHAALTTAVFDARLDTVTAPASGYIIVSASGYWEYDSAPAVARCSITQGFVLDTAALTTGALSSTVSSMPFSINRTFAVSETGSYTYHLLCDTESGTAYVNDTYMNMIFVPTKY
jgi:hypothetical protein